VAGDVVALKAFIPRDLGRQSAMPMFGKDGPFISEEMLWANYAYFIKAVLPVAEEEGLRLALHPDDPPVPMPGGVARLSIVVYLDEVSGQPVPAAVLRPADSR